MFWEALEMCYKNMQQKWSVPFKKNQPSADFGDAIQDQTHSASK